MRPGCSNSSTRRYGSGSSGGSRRTNGGPEGRLAGDRSRPALRRRAQRLPPFRACGRARRFSYRPQPPAALSSSLPSLPCRLRPPCLLSSSISRRRCVRPRPRRLFDRPSRSALSTAVLASWSPGGILKVRPVQSSGAVSTSTPAAIKRRPLTTADRRGRSRRGWPGRRRRGAQDRRSGR